MGLMRVALTVNPPTTNAGQTATLMLLVETIRSQAMWNAPSTFAVVSLASVVQQATFVGRSNCNQPGSGASGGDVQSRIIGYYEGWNQNVKCIGMGLRDIPINGITHLHLAFASLTSTFDVVPMDGLSTQLFVDITALKSQNPGLKVIASIGGWTFSDNGTNTQPIFPDMVSSAGKCSTAITKVLSFLRQYAFDGVDYDWEYPGAGDRGGGKDDGVNFTEFLKQLRAAIDAGPTKYTVSFTAPTSYWYLQHFDIKASTSYVDWVSVMSYDLHGTWDANDPIGNHVLAHTNLTEIKNALDLFWRNDVPATKLNLGLGFYGRSFQLADPACSAPGCLFKGGASPGPCTKNSGTLSYSEIMDVIKQYSLTPVYDVENAVKYITWNNDQWVSFDDKETFQQKIEFANNLGLGGLLIWALDIDTPDLQALQGVLYPKTISALQSQADTADNWQSANGGDCRATTCGTTGCKPGEIEMTTFQCDGDGMAIAGINNLSVVKRTKIGKTVLGMVNLARVLMITVILVIKLNWQTPTKAKETTVDQSPFLPVPLDYLFPKPPPIDTAKAEFKLKTDPTFGGAVTTPFANDPEDAAFGFIVLTSPETIQVSLDKRDGSHWEVFDCFDAVSEAEHTVRMVCTDESHNSNCDKIHLGNGVPGTILEMPEGCGPGKYAVAVQLETSQNQELPQHLSKRDLPSGALVYDLKFDYNFARVPRDLGDTQMRIDFANEDGYWNKVVDKAAGQKRKRSLEHFNGNKKRFLEEAWREDKHLSGLSTEELHKRWFGSDILDWLKGVINGVTGGPAVHHSYVEDFTAILLRESWSCSSGITAASAQLDVVANTHVAINTNFGLTIIATLGSPIDLSNSYLYFRNDGEITAKFTLDALANVNFDTGDMTLLSADKFGAAFAVPGIVTIGPNFKLIAQVEGGITLSAHISAEVNIAKWNVQQTFPDISSDWDPKASQDVDPSGTQDLTPKDKPLFDASVAANGYLTAHLKPTITFGIEFNKNLIPVDPAAVNLVADGFITAYANAGASTSGGASFCYGVDAGAQLYASLSVPSVFGWKLPQSRFQIGDPLKFQIVEETCPVQSSRRAISYNESAIAERAWNQRGAVVPELEPANSLQARGLTYGPILHIPSNLLKCPGDQSGTSTASQAICEFCQTVSSRGLEERSGPVCILREPGVSDEPSCQAPGGASKRSTVGSFFADLVKPVWNRRDSLDKRDRKKIGWSTTVTGLGASPLEVDAGAYPPCSEAEGVPGIPKYYTFDPPTVACSGVVKQQTSATVASLPIPPSFQTDHIYEIQLARDFMQFLKGTGPSNGYNMPNGYKAGSDQWVTLELMGFNSLAFKDQNGRYLWQAMTFCFGGSGIDVQDRLALLESSVNGKKGSFFRLANPDATVPSTGGNPDQTKAHELFLSTGGVFTYMADSAIWPAFTATSKCIEKVLYNFDQIYPWNFVGEIDRPADGTFNGQTFHYGLRSLYCGWIDAQLSTIESNARAWQSNAKLAYANAFPPTNNALAKSFLDNIMGGAGKLTASGMKFTVSGGGPSSSKYGAWGDASLPPPK
ncbi:hypothetical protein MMC30_007989 [Trapelia coarctata]|nr:hypothetical protein [Trapelia coarctata]